jgi:hypothetical protein
MKSEKNMLIAEPVSKDWAETPREKEFVLKSIRAIPTRFGVTPELIARHTVSVNKRDGLKELYNKRVRECMALGRPSRCENRRAAAARMKAARMKRVAELAQACVSHAGSIMGIPPAKILSQCRKRPILRARWVAVLATYRLMEFPSLQVLRRAFGISYDQARHIRRVAAHWPRAVKNQLNKVIAAARTQDPRLSTQA